MDYPDSYSPELIFYLNLLHWIKIKDDKFKDYDDVKAIIGESIKFERKDK